MAKSIYVSSSLPGLLFHGGRFLSALEDKPLKLSPKAEQLCYLQFFPYGMQSLPATVCVSFEEELPQAIGAVMRVWPKGQVELRFEAAPNEDPFLHADDRHLLARSLLTFIRDGRRQSAAMCLSRPFQESLDYASIQSFVGHFDGVEEARFVPPGDHGAVIAVFNQLGPMKTMRLFAFDFAPEGAELLIDNIQAYV